MVTLFPFFAGFAFAIFRIRFVVSAQKRQERFNRPAQRVADAEKCAVIRHEQQPRKERHQRARSEKGIMQNLHIFFGGVFEKALYQQDDENHRYADTKTHQIPYECRFFILVHSVTPVLLFR